MTDLMLKANKILESSGILQKDNHNQWYIEESYNGQTSSFGVTVAMSGLLPALVIFYQETSDNRKIDRKKILVLGSGPIRIGQGVEFDYATVHSVKAIQKAGYEAVIMNSNPETVSTDFSISDKLYRNHLFGKNQIAPDIF